MTARSRRAVSSFPAASRGRSTRKTSLAEISATGCGPRLALAMPRSHSSFSAVAVATRFCFFLASNSSATTANVLACVSARAALLRRFSADGSVPSRNSALASLCGGLVRVFWRRRAGVRWVHRLSSADGGGGVCHTHLFSLFYFFVYA